MSDNSFEPEPRGDDEALPYIPEELRPRSAEPADPNEVRKGCGAFAALFFLSMITLPIYGLGLAVLLLGAPALAIYMGKARNRPRYAKGVWLGLGITIGVCVLLMGACFAFFAIYPPNFH